MTVAAFELAIDRFVDRDIPEAHHLLQRTIAIQVLTGVTYRMPVDKGRARGGTHVTIDAKSFKNDFPADKGGSATIAAGVSVIESSRPYQNIVLQNNVEYIEDLESGRGSKQAPNGMVAVTVAEIEAKYA